MSEKGNPPIWHGTRYKDFYKAPNGITFSMKHGTEQHLDCVWKEPSCSTEFIALEKCPSATYELKCIEQEGGAYEERITSVKAILRSKFYKPSRYHQAVLVPVGDDEIRILKRIQLHLVDEQLEKDCLVQPKAPYRDWRIFCRLECEMPEPDLETDFYLRFKVLYLRDKVYCQAIVQKFEQHTEPAILDLEQDLDCI